MGADDGGEELAANPPQRLVAIGASAGGLEALEHLFDGLTANEDSAFVVVTHLSPDFKSLLDELLARRTPMPVHLVEDGQQLERGAVYVLPPRKDMIVAGDRLYLRDRSKGDLPPVPIDTFFSSLAREWGDGGVGVILSGTGSDGSRGAGHIRSAGGVVIVQDPETARFTGMPEAAIQSGNADYVLNPKRIGRQIRSLGHPGAAEDAPASEDAEAAAMARITLAVFGVSEIDFSCYKTTTFRRRVDRRVAAVNATSLQDYAGIIERDEREARILSDDLLIGVTDFFRDGQAFSSLNDNALHELVEQKAEAGVPLRLWCAGCATGQEAYTLAILIHEAGRRLNKPVAAQIFATDIRESSLEYAARGIYTEEEVRGIEPELLRRYFTQTQGGYQVLKTIRQWVIFANHDLLKSPPFTRVDLIVCRNVLIYIDPEVQQRIFALFHFALNAKGLLFLGPSESLGDLEREFVTVDARWRLYRKAHDRPLHVGPTASAFMGGAMRARADASAHRFLARRKEVALMPAYAALLDRFAPSSALVSPDRELLHTFGDARRFLHPPSGVTNLDIINMVDSALRTPIATGIERALREDQEVIFPDLPLRDASADEHVRLRILPLAEPNDSAVGHVLVVFERSGEVAGARRPEVIDLSGEEISLQRVEELELELKRTRETLQATIEEVETSNEELQSSNEELMAANEELQSTNEELNSVNEELYSVNAEYQRQNEELVSLNADMESLLRATQIGVIFVDERLTIRRSTSAASQLFNIIHEDVGRKLSHLTHRFIDFDATDFILAATTSGEPRERELLSEDGDWWLLRCVPHEFSSGAGRGAVLTLFNIDRLKSAELRASADERRFRAIAKLASTEMYFELDEVGEAQPEFSDFERFSGVTFSGGGDGLDVSAVHPDDRARVATTWATAFASQSSIDIKFRLFRLAEDDFRHVKFVAQYLGGADDPNCHWAITVFDIEETVQSVDVVRHTEQILNLVMASSNSLVSYVDSDGRYRYVNEQYERFWKKPAHEIVGMRVEDFLPHDVYAIAEPYIEAALRGERSEYLIDRRSESGKKQLLSVVYEPHHDQDGAVLGFAVTSRDISSLKVQAEMGEGFVRALGELADRYATDVVLFEPDGLKIAHANQRAQARLGFGLDQLRAKRLTEIVPGVSPERWTRLLAGDAKGDAAPIETFLLARDGTTLDCDATCRPVQLDGRTFGAAIFVDIHSRIDMAKSLRHRTAELAASNRDLEQFASAASHDLRSPLGHISNLVGMVIEDHGAALPEAATKDLQRAAARAVRLQSMVSSLLEYSRLGSTARSFEPVDLGHVVSDVLADFREPLAVIGGAVEAGALPAVKGSPTLLARVFQNLVANAIAYRGLDPLQIRIAAGPPGERATVYVEDNGRGVPPEQADRIFEIFRRLDPPSSADVGGVDAEKGVQGVGLGLSISRRIMELHDGTIAVDPSYGPGARFVLSFPAGG